MSTVGVYRGHHYSHARVRVVFPLAEANPLLWIAMTRDGSDVFGWFDTQGEMRQAIDETFLSPESDTERARRDA